MRGSAWRELSKRSERECCSCALLVGWVWLLMGENWQGQQSIEPTTKKREECVCVCQPRTRRQKEECNNSRAAVQTKKEERRKKLLTSHCHETDKYYLPHSLERC